MRKKRLFIERGHPDGTVVLNYWGEDANRDFKHFADSFHLAAIDAVAALRQNPYFGLDGIPLEDFRAYPVVFLYRHSLELYMKVVILGAASVLDAKRITWMGREKLLKNHKLNVLWNDLERVFEVYGWSWDLRTSHFRSIADWRETIAEFHKIDEDSHAFRYPLDTRGCASLSRHFRFNLFDFCEVLDSLFLGLMGVADAVYDRAL